MTETKWQPLTPMMSATPVSVGPATWLVTIPLSMEDEATINDLRVAYRNSLVVNVEKVVSSRDKANLTDLVNIAELSVRRVIAMVKQVSCGQALLFLYIILLLYVIRLLRKDSKVTNHLITLKGGKGFFDKNVNLTQTVEQIFLFN